MPGSDDHKASVPEAVSTTFVRNFNTLIDTQSGILFLLFVYRTNMYLILLYNTLCVHFLQKKGKHCFLSLRAVVIAG